MDFVGVTEYSLEKSIDPVTGNAVITIKDVSDDSTIVTFTSEVYKVRAIVDSLSEIARNLYADPSILHWTRRSVIDVKDGVASTKLSAPL